MVLIEIARWRIAFGSMQCYKQLVDIDLQQFL